MPSLYGQPGRLNCIVPECRRTAPADRYPDWTEIICGACWRRCVPPHLRKAIRKLDALARRYRRRGDDARLVRTYKMRDRVWESIRLHIVEPSRPVGLDEFLRKTGL